MKARPAKRWDGLHGIDAALVREMREAPRESPRAPSDAAVPIAMVPCRPAIPDQDSPPAVPEREPGAQSPNVKRAHIEK